MALFQGKERHTMILLGHKTLRDIFAARWTSRFVDSTMKPHAQQEESAGTLYRNHLIVPIAGPTPEYLASYLLFRSPRFGKPLRLGTFNVGTAHACAEDAHAAAVQSGKAKVDELLARRWPKI
jgi:hypothetical protein